MALDRFFVVLKVGDCLPFKDGMLLSYIDEAEWGLPIDKILSDHQKKCFGHMEMDRSMKPKVIEWLKPYDQLIGPDKIDIREGPDFRIRSKYIPLDDLAADLHQADLVEKLRSPTEIVPVLDCKLIPEIAFKDTKDLKITTEVGDINSVTSGSYTVGSGGNYATWVEALADVGTLVGDLTFTQISSFTQTARATTSAALAGHALLLTSDSDPAGNFNSGWLTSLNMDDYGIYINNSSTTYQGTFSITLLKFKYIYTLTAGYDAITVVFTGTLDNTVSFISDVLVDCNSKIGGGVRIADGHGRWMNVVVANSTGHGIIWIDRASIECFNCTIYNCNYGFWNYGSFTTAADIYNIASFSNAVRDYCYGTTPTAGIGGLPAYKCASSDTTGSEAGLRSLTVADQVVSTDIANANFMKVKAGATIAQGGTDPSFALDDHGIRGTPRPHIGN